MKSQNNTFFNAALSRVLFVLLTTSIVSSAAFAQMPALDCQSEEAQDIVKKKKKRIKAYVTDFWRLGEALVPSLPVDLRVKGFVAGDLHFGNIDVYLDLGSRPNRTRLTLNDVDEVGTNNYLIVDFMKYLAYLGTLKPALDLDKVTDAYVSGLNGTEAKIPAELVELLKMNAGDFAKKKAKYIAKHQLEGQKLSLAKISKKDQDTQAAIMKLPIIAQMTELQAWTSVNEDGSSAGMMRYLFSGKNSSVPGVIEFKELGCTAAGDVVKQNLDTDIESFINYTAKFMAIPPQHTFLDQQAIAYVDGRYFLVREKVPGLYKDLEIETSSTEVKQPHAEFLASYLGGFHSAKATLGYKQAVANNKAMLIQSTKTLATEFEKQLRDKKD